MAKAALEMAVLDAELRAVGPVVRGTPRRGREAVDCGVSIGIFPTIKELHRPGRRVSRRGLQAHQAEDRTRMGPRAGARRPRALARRPPSGRREHGVLACRRARRRARRRSTSSTSCSSSSRCPKTTCAVTPCSRQQIATPICLDESILSAESAADAIARGACSIVNIKAGRVGGYLEAVRVHDVCQAAGVAVWCGGMLETGLGRAANVALAALPGIHPAG